MAPFFLLCSEGLCLALQRFDGFFERGDTGLCVRFLFLLEFHNLRLGILHEALVAQFGHNAAEEALLVSKVCFQFLQLLIHVDERVHRNSELGCADDELRCIAGYFSVDSYFDIRQFSHECVELHRRDKR